MEWYIWLPFKNLTFFSGQLLETWETWNGDKTIEVFLVFYSISNCLFHLSVNYKYLSWNYFLPSLFIVAKTSRVWVFVFYCSCLRSLHWIVEKSILCSSWDGKLFIKIMQIQFQVSISNKLPHQLSFQSHRLGTCAGPFGLSSFSHHLSTVVRSPAFLMMDMNIAIFLLLFTLNSFREGNWYALMIHSSCCTELGYVFCPRSWFRNS